MLTRCGPASLAKAARQLHPAHRSSLTARLIFPFLRRESPRLAIAFRQLHQTPGWSQLAQESLESQQDTFEEDPPAHELPPQPGINEATHHGPITKFQQLADQGLVNHDVIRTITKRLRLEVMTEVQSMTIKDSLSGSDILAQAKTGTGKTIAFLLPVIQNLLNDKAFEQRRRTRGGSDIRAIIISPTRELAEQIAVEAKKLCGETNIKVQTAVGGTGKRFALKAMHTYGCHLLVGTPGRLQDIFSDPSSGVAAPNLHTLVLDEADRLLDQGFAEDIKNIQRLLPDRRRVDRQTLLYSATVPDEVMNMVDETLKPRYKFIRTVKPGEALTHERVPQMAVVTTGLQNMLPALLELCKRKITAAKDPGNTEASPFKAIVYFGSTANVSYAASVFRNIRESNAGRNPIFSAKIVEMHSKLTQAGRTYASEMFRKSKSAILFSSDVTARGMDFPGVTHIIQLGIPTNPEQYIHRIGRTARGNNTGESWIILGDFEYEEAVRRLRGLPIRLDDSLATASVDMRNELQLPADVAETLTQVSEATLPVEREKKVLAYLAHLGMYAGFRNKRKLLNALNDWVRYGWGWEKPPSVSPQLAQKMGYGGVDGLNLGKNSFDSPEEGSTRPRDVSGFGRGSYSRRDSSRGGGQFGNKGSGAYGNRGFSRGDRQARNSGSGGFSNKGGFSGGSGSGFSRGSGSRSSRGSESGFSRGSGSGFSRGSGSGFSRGSGFGDR